MKVAIISITKVDACIVTVVSSLQKIEKVRRGCQKKHTDTYERMVETATMEIPGSV